MSVLLTVDGRPLLCRKYSRVFFYMLGSNFQLTVITDPLQRLPESQDKKDNRMHTRKQRHVNVDQEKAFDRASWSYMYDTRLAFGSPPHPTCIH